MTKTRRLWVVTGIVTAGISLSGLLALADDCEGEEDQEPAACGGFYDWDWNHNMTTTEWHASPGVSPPDEWGGFWNNTSCLAPHGQPHSQFRGGDTSDFPGSHTYPCNS